MSITDINLCLLHWTLLLKKLSDLGDVQSDLNDDGDSGSLDVWTGEIDVVVIVDQNLACKKCKAKVILINDSH